jgi:hypothetical protein
MSRGWNFRAFFGPLMSFIAIQLKIAFICKANFGPIGIFIGRTPRNARLFMLFCKHLNLLQ